MTFLDPHIIGDQRNIQKQYMCYWFLYIYKDFFEKFVLHYDRSALTSIVVMSISDYFPVDVEISRAWVDALMHLQIGCFIKGTFPVLVFLYCRASTHCVPCRRSLHLVELDRPYWRGCHEVVKTKLACSTKFFRITAVLADQAS